MLENLLIFHEGLSNHLQNTFPPLKMAELRFRFFLKDKTFVTCKATQNSATFSMLVFWFYPSILMVTWIPRSIVNCYIISNINNYKLAAALLWYLVAWALLGSLCPILPYLHKDVWFTINTASNQTPKIQRTMISRE